MKLRELLEKVPNVLQVPNHPALDEEVKGLCTNSHACKPGDLFIGMPGVRVDGGEFWFGAIESGAVAALISRQAAQKLRSQVEPGNEGRSQVEPGNEGHQGRSQVEPGNEGHQGRSQVEPGNEGHQGRSQVEPGNEGHSGHSGHSGRCVITAGDMNQACAHVAAAFYGYPARKLKLIGVTGTNGKTTITHLIEFLLAQAQEPTALLGTLYARWPGYQKTATHTTSFPVELQQQLAEAVLAGCTMGVMEVSSHALAQERVLGCEFEVAVFTNLTQDHLDFHRDMEDYFAAKAKLFSPEYLTGRAIINLDDSYGRRIIEQVPSKQVWSYSVNNSNADLWTSNLTYSHTGVSGMLHTPAGEIAFNSPLVGQYNLANLLAAVGTILHLGLDLESVVAALPQFPGVPGRMERVEISPEQDISVIVDYAHTPDSLENLLKAARPFIKGKMICVFGCGGDRDRTKRPIMGKIAAELADRVVVTSDNPRTEEAEEILQDILIGIPESVKPEVISDRATAIRTAILEASPGDGVLLAGKGHEPYQILGTEKIHFDDREQARDALSQRK